MTADEGTAVIVAPKCGDLARPRGAGAGTGACAVTIARAVRPRVVMAKIVNVDEDRMIIGVEPSP